MAGNLDYEDVPADPKNEAVPERSDTDRDRVVVVPTPAPAQVVVSSGATAQPARQTRTSRDDDDDEEEEEEDGDDDDEDGDDEDGEKDDEEGEEEDEKEGEAARDPGARPRPRTSPGDVGPSRNAPQTRARDAFPPRPPAPARKPPPAPRPPWPPWPAEPDAPRPPPAPRPPRPARAPTPTAAAATTTPSATTTSSSATTTPSGTPSGTPARPRRPEDAAGNATEVAGARELDSKQPDASEKAAAAYEAMLAYMKAKEEEEKKKTEKEKETETEATRGNETRPETSPETRPEDPAKDTAVNGTRPAAAEAHAAEGDETGVPGVGVAEVPGAVGASAAARGGGGVTRPARATLRLRARRFGERRALSARRARAHRGDAAGGRRRRFRLRRAHRRGVGGSEGHVGAALVARARMVQRQAAERFSRQGQQRGRRREGCQVSGAADDRGGGDGGGRGVVVVVVEQRGTARGSEEGRPADDHRGGELLRLVTARVMTSALKISAAS